MRLIRVGRFAAHRYGQQYRGLVIAVHNGTIVDVFPTMTDAQTIKR